MQCPVCPESTLAMTNREGIEIDYCPKCRGVWLDRGELDKIIERSAGAPAATPAAQARPDPRIDPRTDPRNDPRYAPPGGYRHDDDDDDYRKHYGKRKRGGFLGELFDFD